ncbi:MAG: AAA family ATPase [Deltaproteobacteria bacterium]|jgi:hypothetical protein|nr:AAA family ATPase [Deltaproteobacteria bacterium]
MANDMGKKLPELLVGFQDFQQFIDEKAPFVDKTALISDLIRLRGGTYFLSRPRRFGKTLLLDTIQSIFEGRKELFESLDIVKKDLWHDWEPLPVIFLSFNQYPVEPSAIEERLLTDLNDIIRNHDLPMSEATQVSDIALIIRRLSERQTAESQVAGFKPNKTKQKKSAPKNVVLLVDEYDDPLLVNLGNDAAIIEIRRLLHSFYKSIKGCYKLLRFTLITGITKFAQHSLFSGLNNIKDISLKAKYSTICGFTKKEIKRNYGAYISTALKKMKKKKRLKPDATGKAVIGKISEWYDGYSWDGKHRVLNPFSVTSFFDEMHFGYYWYESGSPLSTGLLTLKDDTYFKIFSKSFRIGDTLPMLDVHNLKDEAALFQAGYLTINAVDDSADVLQYILKVPNAEISYAIVKEFIEKRGMLQDPSETIDAKYGKFIEAFDSRDDDECSSIFSSCIGEIVSHLHVHAELAPHVMMYAMLNIKGHRAWMEENKGGGRIELVYAPPSGDVTIIELKFRKAEKGITEEEKQEILNNGVSMAFNQAAEKRYALSYFYHTEKVYVCAASVYGSSDAKIRFKRQVFIDGTIRDMPQDAPAVQSDPSESGGS